MPPRPVTDSNLIRAIEVFVAVAETGQMTAAAQLLGITQSAASQQIATLERMFGTQLLDRSVRPVRLTQEGGLLHRHATEILNAVEDLTTKMRHSGPNPISVLRIGILASIATTLTPLLVAAAQEEFRVQDVSLHAGLSGDHETLLRTKRADIAITSDPFYDMDGLERHPVLQERYLLVLPGDYTGPRDDLAAILKRMPLVRFADTTSVGRQIEQHLRRLKLRPPRVIQADRSSMVTACVASGAGVTFLTPTLLIDGFVERMQLQVLPMPVAGMTRSITVLAREDELGALPARFAQMAADTLTDRITDIIGPVGEAALL
ncbi:MULTISPECIES: LysR family transcriptional regulator [unclassified Roseovarius]|uniref:LysR family transcriptional regulator n=1 Tax=unclassified Roseovarius TaxID=2614913 RepID=UPI00273FB2B7|nr:MULTISPECIES: LysR family transcriptional regulator [unclassified Roseovarius]